MLASFVRVRAAWLTVLLASACSTGDGPRAGASADGARGDEAAGAVSGRAAGRAGAAPGAPTDSLSLLADRGRIQGAASAPIWLVEISDFQCPYCKVWHDETYPTIVREYVATGKLRMAYLNFPLSSHPHAWPAAEAAMCAGVQGKFWEVHDAIFDTQRRWAALESSRAFFDSLAVARGVDRAAFRACMDSRAMPRIIQADLDRSLASGVSSTPTFFVGDEVIEGAAGLDVFRRIIDAALAKAGAAKSPTG